MRRALVLGLILLGAPVLSGCGTASSGPAHGQPHGAGHDPRGSSASSPSLGAGVASVGAGRYGIIERRLAFGPVGGADPWDVPVTVALTSPSGRVTQIGGYYYGSGVWKFRFSPSQPGHWRWRALLASANGAVVATRSGTFTTPTTREPGFVRVSHTNPYLWSFESGSPYYPLGLETCLVDDRRLGSPYHFVLDGGLRATAGANGSLVGARGRSVDLATYIRTYAQAGFNLFRWSVDNCSFGLYSSIAPTGNVYSEAGGHFGDQLVSTLHRYGMRVYMAIFGNNPPDANGGTDPSEMAAIERYVRYVVNRYGASVDFWELMNETTRSPAWYQQVTSYLRSIDPYHHPISTSHPPANLSLFDINSPHWYEHESEFASDIDTFQRFAGWKAAGKPVIVGEQGNSGQNWDPRSGVRMRLRSWAAFFSQGSLIFWNEVAFKDLVNASAADLWLGPTERRYSTVLSHFTQGFDSLARMATAQVAPRGLVRAYELTGPRMLAVYVTAYTNHTSLTNGATVQINPGFRGTASWISPATGQILRRVNVRRGVQLLHVPAFNTDVVLKAVRGP